MRSGHRRVLVSPSAPQFGLVAVVAHPRLVAGCGGQGDGCRGIALLRGGVIQGAGFGQDPTDRSCKAQRRPGYGGCVARIG